MPKPSLTGAQPLDDLSKLDLSRCYLAISRRLVAAQLAVVSREDRNKRQKLAVWIPDEEDGNGPEVVEKVILSIKGVIETMGRRDVDGVEAALEGWVSAAPPTGEVLLTSHFGCRMQLGCGLMSTGYNRS